MRRQEAFFSQSQAQGLVKKSLQPGPDSSDRLERPPYGPRVNLFLSILILLYTKYVTVNILLILTC